MRNHSFFAPTLLGVACLLQACTNTEFSVQRGASDERLYEAIFPYYAEFCAVSEFDKLPGFGIELSSGGPGGHSVLYLNGVCRVRDAGYPVVTLCNDPHVGDGVGISVNAHYSNANWTATEGRDFFFHGDLEPGEALTPASYARTQARAKAMGILDGVVFHKEVFDDKPAGMSKRDYMYETSVATDYAINFGRDRYCARVPLDRMRMGEVVEKLNAANARYRSGVVPFQWSVLRDNCAHLTHNVLSAVGLWREWPIDRPLLIAAFDFPVPKNEFVNLMRRTNDLPIQDPAAIEDNDVLREALLTKDWLPTRPGGLAEAEPAIQKNELYGTKLRLIFYDEPVFGHYQEWFEQIFSEPRYTDLNANFAYFAAVYDRILATRPAVLTGPQAAFDRLYYGHIAAERDALNADRAALRKTVF